MGFSVWGLTSVVYKKDDRLSFAFGAISLLPVLSVFILFAIGVQRPSQTMSFLITGTILNFVFSIALKKMIQEPRPQHPWGLAHREDYGMPSNHSQFMAFLFGAILMIYYERCRGNKPGRFSLRRALHVLMALVATTLVMASRVYNHYHTREQVIAGAALGIATALALYRVRCLRRIVAAINRATILPLLHFSHWFFFAE